MRRLVLFLFAVFLSACASRPHVPIAVKHANQGACVVLIHGLWRSGMAMNVIASDLAHYGYHTVTVDYPSTQNAIGALSDQYLAPAVDACKAKSRGPVHIVSHSMGGILARHYLQTRSLPEGSRVVMLSPPNQGAALSEYFAGTWWYDWIVGPAGAALTKQAQGIIGDLEPIGAPVGVIAAYRDWSLWPEAWLPAPNDGTVALQNMWLEEMHDWVVINSGHAMMRYHSKTHDYIRQFLREARFQPRYSEDEQAFVDAWFSSNRLATHWTDPDSEI